MTEGVLCCDAGHYAVSVVLLVSGRKEIYST